MPKSIYCKRKLFKNSDEKQQVYFSDKRQIVYESDSCCYFEDGIL